MDSELERFATVAADGVRHTVLLGAELGNIEAGLASLPMSLVVACVEHPEWARYWYQVLGNGLPNVIGAGDDWIENLPVESVYHGYA